MDLSGEPRCLGISPEGSHIAFIIGGLATVVDTEGKIISRIEGVEAILFGVDWHSLYLLRRKGSTNEVCQYDLPGNVERSLFQIEGINCIAMSSTGKYLAFIREIPDETAKHLKEALANQTSNQPNVDFVKRAQDAILEDLPTKHEFCLYDVTTWALVRSPIICSSKASIVFSPDGKFVAFVSAEGIMRAAPDAIMNAVSSAK
jgi:hypothetical protein